MVKNGLFTAAIVVVIIVLMNAAIVHIVNGEERIGEFDEISFCKKIDLNSQIPQRSDLSSKVVSILSTFTLTHQSKITAVIGNRISYYSESTTTPPTIMPYMGVQSSIYYSTDQINWGSPLKQTIVTGNNKLSVRASSDWLATTPGYYVVQGCHQGTIPGGQNYHVDTYSTIVEIS
jgi:hypothetical protein